MAALGSQAVTSIVIPYFLKTKCSVVLLRGDDWLGRQHYWTLKKRSGITAWQ